MADDLLTPEAFAQSIKAKYPQYAAVPDADLADKMLEKYPEYRSRVRTYAPDPTMQAATARAMARDAGMLGVNAPMEQHEPDTWTGGFTKSLKDQILGATVGNPQLQGAAHPSSAGDVASLMFAPTDATRSVAASALQGPTGLIAASKEAAETAPSWKRVPGQMMKILYRNATETAPTVERSSAGAVVDRYAPSISAGPQTGSYGPSAEGIGTSSSLPSGVTEDQLRAAGVGDASINLMRNPRPPLMPVASHAPVNAGATAPALMPTELPPDMPNVASTPLSQPMGTPRPISLKPYTEQLRSTYPPATGHVPSSVEGWTSGTAGQGTAETASAHALHREDAALASRFRHLMDSRSSALIPGAALGNELRKALLEKLGQQDE